MSSFPSHDPPTTIAQTRSLRFLVRFPHDSYAWLGLAGELDMANADQLSSVLEAIHAAGARTVEVDATEVTFAGCAFLGVIERHARRFEDSGGWLVVAHASRPVERLFDLALGRGLRSEDSAFRRLEPPSGASVGD